MSNALSQFQMRQEIFRGKFTSSERKGREVCQIDEIAQVREYLE
jgi:hypothetical protein